MSQDSTIAVVGGGLVGSLCACMLGKRGFQVDLYESRDDMRTQEHVTGRSINLALSTRGRAALSLLGLEEQVIERHGIPMNARLIHDLDGKRRPIPYGQKGQCIYSVGRRYLNEVLLSACEKNQRVKLHFKHKLKSANLDQGKLNFARPDGTEHTVQRNVIIGCDGAYSAVRREMLKRPLFNYSQSYIPHGYIELCIPPTHDGKFAMEVNYLHIWPRGKFMLIALPNQDCTYTVTLFMPFDMFYSLSTREKLLDFFGQYFPDAIPLIGKDDLVETFFSIKPSPLVMVKCKPYHVGGKVLIMGDAAHAMVPFYGQGMNAGFEDCCILNELLDIYGSDFDEVFPKYTEVRNPDAEAICDLALYNYIEMRDLVNSPMFLLRKKFDIVLNKLMPNFWIPLYTSVTFSRLRYHKCIENRAWQDKVITRLLGTVFVSGAVAALAVGVQAVLKLNVP
ncbi:kynurenine 3-monooxygenase-like [Ornithodoros turicata]|uniref:kynurenine 3-monooxygenase-like n=1 Tax=Ornithodoros turicata TaxID=34597 RepID=UPI0031392EAA